ncbi:sensory neuron membrane protein 2-like isoform X2 [Macrobrachium nipponense]|uniref:sensory neuron membrane protein 2-like isoform X2 n=1 Tax=Macrobrachium nipponense TaxID=159736 RepID=UPI0030C7FD74
MEETKKTSGYDNEAFVNSQEGVESPPKSSPNPEVLLSVSHLQQQKQHSTEQQQRAKSKTKEHSRTHESQRLSGCHICLLLSSSLTILFSVAMLAGGFWKMFDAIMKSQMEVREGSMSFDIWKTTPFPLILNLYVWNITNQKEFLNGEKPVLQECGPYVWREYHDKKGIEFHSNNTVTYLQQRWWIWDEELSGENSLDDMVFAMNPVPLSSTWSVRHNPFTAMPCFLNDAFNRMGEEVSSEDDCE